MNHVFTLRVLMACLFLCGASLQAQRKEDVSFKRTVRQEADKRINNYLKLVELGYSDREIYEDLGNANFLSENYETAAFWYQKLIDLRGADAVSQNYLERYKYAQHKAGIVSHNEVAAHRDWYSRVKEDYQISNASYAAELTQTLAANYEMPEFGRSGHQRDMDGLNALRAISDADLAQVSPENIGIQNAYLPPVAVTADGQTAYFSKAVAMRPLTGIFSKKQLVHKLYRAKRKGGEWTEIREIAVAPKYASAMHPSVSEDGKRLYFASDMPGSFGKFDIYVAEIDSNGELGVARNLGEKVNTRRNEMYPTMIKGDVLFFASDGRDGYGGMDLYASRVASQKVGLAVNIGSPFNSGDDDFALNLQPNEGVAYVMSNRNAGTDEFHELAFSYGKQEKNSLADSNYSFMEILSVEPTEAFAETYFEN